MAWVAGAFNPPAANQITAAMTATMAKLRTGLLSSATKTSGDAMAPIPKLALISETMVAACAKGGQNARVEHDGRAAIPCAKQQCACHGHAPARTGCDKARANGHGGQRMSGAKPVAKREHGGNAKSATQPMRRHKPTGLPFAKGKIAGKGWQRGSIKRLASTHHDKGGQRDAKKAEIGPDKFSHMAPDRGDWPGVCLAASEVNGLRILCLRRVADDGA